MVTSSWRQPTRLAGNLAELVMLMRMVGVIPDGTSAETARGERPGKRLGLRLGVRKNCAGALTFVLDCDGRVLVSDDWARVDLADIVREPGCEGGGGGSRVALGVYTARWARRGNAPPGTLIPKSSTATWMRPPLMSTSGVAPTTTLSADPGTGSSGVSWRLDAWICTVRAVRA